MALPVIFYGLGAVGLGVAVWELWPRAAKSTGNATDLGTKDGCERGTLDGKAGAVMLNPIDTTVNPELKKAADASGDPTNYLSAYGKAYDSCADKAKPVAPPGTTTPPPKTVISTDVACGDSKTWPSKVVNDWNNYQAHKTDAGDSAYAKSGQAQVLYGEFKKMNCIGNANVVQATIQRWIDSGKGSITGGPDCKSKSTWPAPLRVQYDAYLADEYAYVDAGKGPALVAGLNDVGCPGTAAAVQHTIDLEIANGKLHADGSAAWWTTPWKPPGASTSGRAAGVFGLVSVGRRPPVHYADRFRALPASRVMREAPNVTSQRVTFVTAVATCFRRELINARKSGPVGDSFAGEIALTCAHVMAALARYDDGEAHSGPTPSPVALPPWRPTAAQTDAFWSCIRRTILAAQSAPGADTSEGAKRYPTYGQIAACAIDALGLVVTEPRALAAATAGEMRCNDEVCERWPAPPKGRTPKVYRSYAEG